MVELCIRDPDSFVEALVKFSSVRGTMLVFYTDAITRNEIQSLYSQPEEIKRHYWQESKSEARGRLTKGPLMDLAKALYYLDFLLSKYAL